MLQKLDDAIDELAEGAAVVDGNVERDEIEVAGEGLELRGGGEPGAVEAGDVQHERARAILAGGIRGEGEKNRGGPPDVAARRSSKETSSPRDGAVPRESEDILAKGRRRGGRGRRGRPARRRPSPRRPRPSRAGRRRVDGTSEVPTSSARDDATRARAREEGSPRERRPRSRPRETPKTTSRERWTRKVRATLCGAAESARGEMTCTRRWCRVTADQGCRAPTDRGRPSR